MRISDWTSDVCSSDLPNIQLHDCVGTGSEHFAIDDQRIRTADADAASATAAITIRQHEGARSAAQQPPQRAPEFARRRLDIEIAQRCSRSEEHTSELQSLMRISYAVFCLKKKKKKK